MRERVECSWLEAVNPTVYPWATCGHRHADPDEAVRCAETAETASMAAAGVTG